MSPDNFRLKGAILLSTRLNALLSGAFVTMNVASRSCLTKWYMAWELRSLPRNLYYCVYFTSEDYLNRLTDSGDDDFASQQKDVDLSDVEDHVELDDMVPTDSDSDHDIQPIRLPQHHRRSGVILSSDSETEEIPELFDPVFSGTRYISVMSRERFDFLLNCLRFDDKSTRDERKAQDKFAPIREWWEVFIQICRDSYKAGSYLTIDEQLLGFRGRCPFRMYIPSKPNKYGLKILMLCDSKTNYMLNAMPYVGKTETNGDSLGSYYVKTLTENLWGSNRNVTMDNWFTSVPLALELLQAPYKCTIVGTLRANKREIPPELLQIKERPIGSSVFCYDRQCTLVSYKPKNNKNVLLLSTTHSNGTIAASGKPEIIEFYNSTKGAVDTFDQMCGRRKPTSRRCFVKNVSEKLTEPWLRKKTRNANFEEMPKKENRRSFRAGAAADINYTGKSYKKKQNNVCRAN
ncbi:PiggyBac transposable element-derived protein 4 [Eumeta japonica]|uniref:PiggyBac transposable element-derived protein 4 n=1 Tax=Eumeta variegata TaxID=151549 RepID=A0A4C1V2R5_EUMVA|nr:PiggyBac transposable element-derived protein 4 [Eumeta japonica]